MENTNWLILLLARDFFGLGLTLGQFIAILLSVAMVCCVISSNTWAVVLLLPVTLWLAGVGIGWCVNVFFLSLLVYLIVIRQVPVLMALFIFIAILLCEWLLFPAVFQSMFTTSDKMQMIAEEHGTGGGTQASSSPSSSAPSGSTTVQEKVLKPNAVALWWDGLNLNPGEKPRNPIPAGISCSFITDQAPAMTAIAKEIYQVQCWSGDWSAEGECNGYFARGVGVVAKKGVVTQVDGKGQYPDRCYDVVTKVVEAPVAEASGPAAVVAASGQYRVKDTDGAWLWTGSGYTSVGAIVYDTIVEVTGKTKSPKSYKGNPDRCILGGVYTGISVHCGALEPVVP